MITKKSAFSIVLLLCISVFALIGCGIIGNDSENDGNFEGTTPPKLIITVVEETEHGDSSHEIEHFYYDDNALRSLLEELHLSGESYGYKLYGYFTERNRGGMCAFDSNGNITEEYKNYILQNKPESVTVYYRNEPMDAKLKLIYEGGEKVYDVKMFESFSAENLYMPEKHGYIFRGWKGSENGTHGWMYVSVDHLETVYYAHFEPIKVKTEVFATPQYNTSGNDVNIVYDSDYKLEYKEYDGYNFRGYFSEKDGCGTQFTDKDGNSLQPWSLLNDPDVYGHRVEIYAYYAPAERYKVYVSSEGLHVSYTVTYMDAYQQAEGRDSVTRSATNGKRLEYITPHDIPEGMYFAGWYEDKKFTKKFDFSKPVNADITLYPSFKKYPSGVSGSIGCGVGHSETYLTANRAAETKRRYVVMEDAVSDIVISVSLTSASKIISASIYNSTQGRLIANGTLTKSDPSIIANDVELSAGDILILSVSGEGDPESVKFMFNGFTEPKGSYAEVPEYFEFTVTQGNSYKIRVFGKSYYEFVGYYTLPNGEGVRLTDEKGNSIGPYDLGNDATFYPYYVKEEDTSQ